MQVLPQHTGQGVRALTLYIVGVMGVCALNGRPPHQYSCHIQVGCLIYCILHLQPPPPQPPMHVLREWGWYARKVGMPRYAGIALL